MDTVDKETIIELIRHGEPEGGSKYRGHGIDDPLTEKGWKQMWHGVGNASHWDYIVSSPLVRCAAFAEELGQRHQIPVKIENNLKEIGFGEWEGKTRQQLKQERSEEFHAFYADPVINTPEKAEKVDVFFERISNIYNDILNQNIGKSTLIVAHAGVIRAALIHAIGGQPANMYNLEVKNGMLSRVRYNQSRIKLEMINGIL